MINWKKFWQNEGKNDIDKDFVQIQKSISKDIEKIIIRNNYKTILDFGCGTGDIIRYLSRKFPKNNFTGFDISEYMIKKNNINKTKNLSFYVKDLNKIPKTRKFDLILCISTLHYFSNPIKKIQELLKILNDNGSLIINYPNRKLLKEIKRDKTKTEHWKNRFELMYKNKNLISRKDIRMLGYKVRIIRKKRVGNEYLQIVKDGSILKHY